MDVTADDVKAIFAEVRARAPIVGRVSDRDLNHLVTTVIRETNTSLKGIEARIAEAGSMPADVATILLLYGSLYAVLSDMPRTENRRTLLDAGEAVGKLIRTKYAEKIGETLKNREGGN